MSIMTHPLDSDGNLSGSSNAIDNHTQGYCTKHATYYQFDGKVDICPVCLGEAEKSRRMEEIREALGPWLKKIEQLHLLHAGVAIDMAKTYGRLEEIERMLRDL